MIRLVYRCVQCFEKVGDELIKEIPLRGISLSQLQKIFGITAEDPMYDGFFIERRHASLLEPYLPEKLDLESYDCFLDCSAIPIKGERAKEG